MTTTYRQAGVNIAQTDRLLNRLKPAIRATHGAGVLPDVGQFAGLFQLPKGLREPILVSSTDGVGTKLKVAQLVGDHASIGIDAVAMNVNDVLVYGARPLFVLDYIAMGKIDPALFAQLVRGVAEGCRQSGCALLGGETAEMPGVYGRHEYDIAGFCVGVVERRRLLDGSGVREGDAIIGLASSGVHANGFSLVRAALGPAGLRRWKARLLRPTRIYVQPVLHALSRVPVSALVHVTGGGLARRLPALTSKQPTLMASWEPGSWPVPNVFDVIQRAGGVSDSEMMHTFNMGIGMALACRPAHARRLMQMFARTGVAAWRIGTITSRTRRATTDGAACC